MPTAMRPGRSRSPPRCTTSAKKSCGISMWMPAPSPVLPSASTAPRCQTAFSASMPACTTWRRGLAVERGDEADAAGIVLGGVDMGLGEGGEVGAVPATKSLPDSVMGSLRRHGEGARLAP